MRLERSKDWWMARARREGNAAVGVGLLAFDPVPEERPSGARAAPGEETRIAFGKFVNLMRRRRGYTIERLAEVADLDESELVEIEGDVHYVPAPRTIFCHSSCGGSVVFVCRSTGYVSEPGASRRSETSGGCPRCRVGDTGPIGACAARG